MPFWVECVALLGGLEQGPPRQELSSSSALALLMFLPETLFSGSLPESGLTHFYPISLDSALNLQGTPQVGMNCSLFSNPAMPISRALI